MYTEEMVDEGVKRVAIWLEDKVHPDSAWLRKMVEDIILAALSVQPVGEF